MKGLLVSLIFGLISLSMSDSTIDKFIVTLRQEHGISAFVKDAFIPNSYGSSDGLENLVETFLESCNGFVLPLQQFQLEFLRSLPQVNSIEIDRMMSINLVQANATWNLARVSQRAQLSASPPYHYLYKPLAGKGVDIYIIDTGIQINHTDFGTRARLGINLVKNESFTDLNGHGTHVSGTAAGTKYGIAKEANLIAVKVLNENGSGSISDIILGIDYVVKTKARRSVMNLSLGGSVSAALNMAIKTAVESGIVAVVAAGNSNLNACFFSPASAPEAITVAASDIEDRITSFSNYGSCVDIFAPGQGITSAWLNNGVNTISGTSMASPAVAGVAALMLAENPQLTPADVNRLLRTTATTNVIHGNTPIPIGSLTTPNRLVYSSPKLILNKFFKYW